MHAAQVAKLENEHRVTVEGMEGKHAARMAELEHKIQHLQKSQALAVADLKSENETTKETHALSIASAEDRHQQAVDALHQEQQVREQAMAELRASQEQALQAKHQEELLASMYVAQETSLEAVEEQHRSALNSATQAKKTVELVTAEHEEALAAHRSAEINTQRLEDKLSQMQTSSEEAIDALRSEHASMSTAAAHEHEQELRQLTKEATDEIAKRQTASDSEVPLTYTELPPWVCVW